MQQHHAVEQSPPPPEPTRHRSLLSWWPLATGLALGAFSIATDDPRSVDGVLLTLLIPTCAYAVIAFTGRRSWSWPLTGLVVLVLFGSEALSASGPVTLSVLTVAVVVLGAALGRWRPPLPELRWQPWGAGVFLAGVILGLFLDITAAKIVLAVGLLAHGAWDIAHLRRRAVVSRSLAEWCAALDISLGAGVLVLLSLP